RRGRVRAEVRFERLRAIGLVVARVEHALVVGGRNDDLAAVGEYDLRVLDVRGGKLAVHGARRRVEARGKRKQLLALLVEHVLLLAEILEDREAVRRERRRLAEPLLYGRLRNAQQLRREPRGDRAEPREQRAHALEFARDILDPRVGVALQL